VFIQIELKVKKIIYLLMATALVIGCTDRAQKVSGIATQEVSFDTTIRLPYAKAITRPRFSCSGQRLPQDKFIGMDTSTYPKSFSFKKTVTFGSADSLADGTRKRMKQEQQEALVAGASSNDWFWDLFKWLLLIAAIAGLIWLLAWLFRNWPRRTSSTVSTSPSASAASTVGPTSTVPLFAATPASFKTTKDGKPASSIEGSTGYEGPIALVQQLQKTGGKVSWGDLDIEIPPRGVNINIDNTYGKIGGRGIEISVMNEENLVDATSTHYHKTTGGSKDTSQSEEKDKK
jgi:hypothetical protein